MSSPDQPVPDQPVPDQPVPDRRRGWGLVKANWALTVVLAAVLGAGLAAPDVFEIVVVAFSVICLVVGIVAFVYSFFAAVERSRTEEISTAGMYMLAEGAPAATRWNMVGAVVVQTAVSVTAASLRPFTALAFGVLVPMLGLGISGIWSARYGVFRPRTR